MALGWAVLLTSLMGVTAEESAQATAKIDRESRKIEGFSLLVDKTLLPGGTHEKLGERTLALARADFVRINMIVPEAIVEAWQKITIIIDREHPLTTNMQYHPSLSWLIENHYEPVLAKCVHIAMASRYASADHYFVQPSAMIHELAHAYHDQVLSFEEKQIIAAFARAQLEGKYEKVLFVKGGQRKHYALTNHKEYFAESTEAWFGTNDFFPFVRGELKQHDPRMYDLMQKIWNPKK